MSRTTEMISRTRAALFPPLKTPMSLFSSSSSAQQKPEPNRDRERDSAILARFRHKDWLTPKQATNLVNSLSHPSSALTLFHLYSSRKDYTPTEPFCTSLVTKLAQAQQLGPIQSLLKQAHRSSFSDDFFFALIKLYAHVANRIDKSVQTLLDMPKLGTWPSPKTFNFVLNLLVNNKLYDVAFEVYASAPKLGVEIDACCLNILIKGLCGRGQLNAAFEVFDEFGKLGLSPNARTYSTLMHAMCDKGMVDEAFGMLERMEREGVCADAVVYNVLISGLRKAGKVEEAKEVLEEVMVRNGCDPNAGTYQELLYGLLDAKRFLEAKGIVVRMVREGYVPGFASYKLLVLGMCEEGLVGEVDWAIRDMVRRGFVPRMGMWKQIVKCVLHKDDEMCVSLDGVLDDEYDEYIKS